MSPPFVPMEILRLYLSPLLPEQLSNSDCIDRYPKLGNFALIADHTNSMFLASSDGKFASLMAVKTNATFVKMVLDDDATTWLSQVINEPALDDVRQQRVYYIEISVEDSNRMPVVGELGYCS